MNDTSLSIAIIGMAGRFPDAEDLDAFWDMLKAGREGIRQFSEEELRAAGVSEQQLRQPNYVKAGSVLPGALDFDAGFFDMSRRDAEITDPQQRLFLEQVWHALEQAGYPPSTTQARIGLYAGVSDNSYQGYYLEPRLEELLASVGHYRLFTLSGKDFIATRTAYLLNLTGPAMSIQTACSTSLVAIHVACQSLLNDECDLALAGGASVPFPQVSGYLYQEGMILSPDGHCRTFDAQAQGTAPGSGVGVVVLKRLDEAVADGDTIYAAIRGSALNNDGAEKVGYTAPSVSGQREVIREAQAVADLESEQISYVEAHGTATPLGDPIEIQALTQAFRRQTTRVGYCALGSVKSNIGHADAAAGVAGLIKTALALHHRQIPPSLHFQEANPQLGLADSPFFVNDRLRDWVSDGPRYAGVSSFGIGGTNAHVVLEEAPAPQVGGLSRPMQLFTLSAKTSAALQQAQADVTQWLRQHPEAALADVAYTLNRGRHAFRRRAFWVGDAPPETALPGCTAPTQPREVLFLFPGQGSQYPGMARALYQHEAVFREALDECAGHLRPYLDGELSKLLYQESTANLQQTALTQPLLFAVEYALATLWISWGIRPKGLLGHSLGEYVAACLAGVFSLQDALRLVAERGRLIQAQPESAMLTVPLAEAELATWLNPDLSLCVVNGAQRCVVGGSAEAVADLQARLQAQGIDSRRLHTSHAFHSHWMEPVLPAFRALLRSIHFQPPTQPWLSNLTGDWITPEQAIDPEYWCRHLRQPVRFADNLGHALASGQVLLEVGPGQTLTALARQHPAHTPDSAVFASLPRERDSAEHAELKHCLSTLGALWSHGVAVDWEGFYQGERRCRIPLPGYPFERQRYCIDRQIEQQEEALATLDTSPPSPPHTASPSEQVRQITDLWSASLGVPVAPNSDFFELGGDSLLASQVIVRMNRHFGANLDAHALLQAPTPAQLAALLQPASIENETPAHDEISDLVVPIQTGDSNRPPLVLLHPVGGHVYFYRDLARHLDPTLPVYGIRAVGIHGEAEPLTTIEDMAEVYTTALKTLQPAGPYYLAGASFGGTLAYAMAQRLIAEQETVAFLGLIDTPSHGNMPVELEQDGTAGILFYLLTVGHKVDLDQAAFAALDEAARFTAFFHHTKQEDTPAAREDLRIVLKLFQVNMRAMRDYIPDPYPGKLHFFLAKERDAFNAQTPAHGWIPLAEQGIEIYTVPGDHISMNEAPNIQELARYLRQALPVTLLA